MDFGPDELLPLEFVLDVYKVLFRISFSLLLPSFPLEPLFLRSRLNILFILEHIFTPQELPLSLLLLFLSVDFILDLTYHLIHVFLQHVEIVINKLILN